MLIDRNTYMSLRSRQRCIRCGLPAMYNDVLCGRCHNRIVMATMPRYNPRAKERRMKQQFACRQCKRHVKKYTDGLCIRCWTAQALAKHRQAKETPHA